MSQVVTAASLAHTADLLADLYPDYLADAIECHARQDWRRVIRLWWELSGSLWTHGHWREYEALESLTLRAAEELAIQGEATGLWVRGAVLSELAWLMMERGEFRQAQSLLARAAKDFTAAGDAIGMARVYRYAANVAYREDNLNLAEDECSRALAELGITAVGLVPSDFRRAVEDLVRSPLLENSAEAGYGPPTQTAALSRGLVLFLRSGIRRRQRRLAEAEADLQAARAAIVAAGFAGGYFMPGVYTELGRLREQAGEFAAAVVFYGRAAADCVRQGIPDREAAARLRLADLLAFSGSLDLALIHAQKAVALYRDLAKQPEIRQAVACQQRIEAWARRGTVDLATELAASASDAAALGRLQLMAGLGHLRRRERARGLWVLACASLNLCHGDPRRLCLLAHEGIRRLVGGLLHRR